MFKASVVDNGKGIRPEDKAKLFNQFGKLMRTASMNNEGIGMGLMICRNLVHLNSGTITVHSEGEDKGSIFTFTMKMQLPDDSSSEDIACTGETGGIVDKSLNSEDDKNEQLLEEIKSEIRRSQDKDRGLLIDVSDKLL